ncbi:hypothetical protein, partial [Staphylococcus epidermidis]|uniref:hypothetical protein n=1 Tax=Staphylococcus epidermidis TaxID=1282 RepID=UPI001C92F5FA
NPTHPKKHQYNHTVTQLENIINQQHPTFHKQIINQLTHGLNQPNNHLNPLQLLHPHNQNPHQSIPTFIHLNQPQQNPL